MKKYEPLRSGGGGTLVDRPLKKHFFCVSLPLISYISDTNTSNWAEHYFIYNTVTGQGITQNSEF